MGYLEAPLSLDPSDREPNTTPNLRTDMSSIMRRRNGLMGFSLIGGSCLEVGVL